MKTNTLIDRRSFVKMAGAAWAAALSPRGAFALERADAVFASAFMAPDGSYGVATLTEAGEIVERRLLPARAHGMSLQRRIEEKLTQAFHPERLMVINESDQHGVPVRSSSARTCP